MALAAMGTAGYTWRVARLPGFLVLRKDEMRPGGLGFGATSEQELRFKATDPGSGTLVLMYQQGGAGEPEEKLELEVGCST